MKDECWTSVGHSTVLMYVSRGWSLQLTVTEAGLKLANQSKPMQYSPLHYNSCQHFLNTGRVPPSKALSIAVASYNYIPGAAIESLLQANSDYEALDKYSEAVKANHTVKQSFLW
jgi:hypothetical protein